jgi:hypothetical protein
MEARQFRISAETKIERARFIRRQGIGRACYELVFARRRITSL